MTTATLQLRRISPQKVRLVADQIRGLPVDRALNLLSFSDKKAAAILKKLLESAVANAEHNDGADIDALRITTICVDQGPTLKRMQTRARGRANKILKRMSRVTLAVTESEK